MAIEVVKFKYMEISETSNGFYFHQYINFELKNKKDNETLFFKKMHILTEVYKKNNLKDLMTFKKLLNNFFNRSEIKDYEVVEKKDSEINININLVDNSKLVYDCKTFNLYDREIEQHHNSFCLKKNKI
jgi:hypothetical protein